MAAGRRAAILMSCVLLAAGCRNKDLLETELRTREIQYNDLLDKYDQAEYRSHALERELAALHQGAKISPEEASQTFTVKRIALGRLTGGQDTDKVAGDDALLLVVEPRDVADHVLKAPGSLHVLALEVNAQGLKTPLCSWDIGPDELRRSWKNSLFSSGYVLTLPWKSWPTSENLRVVARLLLPDGRAFEADKDIRIRVIPGAHHPAPPSMPGPFVPEPDHLHMPRPFDGQSQSPAPAPTPVTPASDWRPVSLEGAVKLQRPMPFNID
jgi:hypothetical protein